MDALKSKRKVFTFTCKEQFLSPELDVSNSKLPHLAGGQELHAFGHLEAVADQVLHGQVFIV